MSASTDNILRLLVRSPILPVLVIEEVDTAVPLCLALARGGISLAEVTLRSPAALEATRRIAAEVPAVTVGVGTVRSPADMRRAREAGASFVVSPGSSLTLLEAAETERIPYLPAAATPSEIMTLASHGYHVQKLFPAAALGGPAMLNAMRGPFPDVYFCPSGGINHESAADYLRLPNVIAVGGSWVTPDHLVRARAWDAIAALARSATEMGMRCRSSQVTAPV